MRTVYIYVGTGVNGRHRSSINSQQRNRRKFMIHVKMKGWKVICREVAKGKDVKASRREGVRRRMHDT